MLVCCVGVLCWCVVLCVVLVCCVVCCVGVLCWCVMLVCYVGVLCLSKTTLGIMFIFFRCFLLFCFFPNLVNSGIVV